jgi:hypothetical protein
MQAAERGADPAERGPSLHHTSRGCYRHRPIPLHRSVSNIKIWILNFTIVQKIESFCSKKPQNYLPGCSYTYFLKPCCVIDVLKKYFMLNHVLFKVIG